MPSVTQGTEALFHFLHPDHRCVERGCCSDCCHEGCVCLFTVRAFKRFIYHTQFFLGFWTGYKACSTFWILTSSCSAHPLGAEFLVYRVYTLSRFCESGVHKTHAVLHLCVNSKNFKSKWYTNLQWIGSRTPCHLFLWLMDFFIFHLLQVFIWQN